MTATGMEERKVHLREYWQVAWQGKLVVLAIALIVVTLVAITTFLQTPIYRATAALEIQPRAKSISPAADFSQIGAMSWGWMAEERYINTQLEIVHSRDIALAAIQDMGIEGAPRFSSVEDPASALANAIELEILQDTYVLKISVEDVSPSMAQLIVNGVAHAYIDANIESAAGNALRIVDELATQIDPIKDSIAKKERTRYDLARSQEYYVPEAQESTLERQLAQLQNELTRVKITRGEREAIFAIKDIEIHGGSYESIAQVAEDPTILGLKEQAHNLEQQVERLSVTYREGHPLLMAAQKALAEIPAKIESETAQIIVKIKTEDDIDKRREKDLEKQLRLAREVGLGLTQTANQIDILDAEIKEERRIYGLITSRIKEIELNKDTLVNNIRLLEEAALPKYPVRPRKILNLAAGVLLGLFLGLGAVFLIDYLDNTIKSSEDIERFLNLPLLAMVPKHHMDKQASVKEAFQTLRTSVLFASKGRSLRTLLVTSAGPGEGKSLIIVRLAKTLAQAGDRVVLLDGDLRRPTVHSNLSLERAGGLTDALLARNGDESWLRYLKDVKGVDNLKVLTCGPLPPNPVELFDSKPFADMLGQLRQRFDWVLIDSPPLASLSDSIVLGSLVDMTILVIKQNENDRDLIRRTTEQLLKVNANVIGAILNSVDLKRLGLHDYYYAGYEYNTIEDQTAKKKVPLSAQHRT